MGNTQNVPELSSFNKTSCPWVLWTEYQASIFLINLPSPRSWSRFRSSNTLYQSIVLRHGIWNIYIYGPLNIKLNFKISLGMWDLLKFNRKHFLGLLWYIFLDFKSSSVSSPSHLGRELCSPGSPSMYDQSSYFSLMSSGGHRPMVKVQIPDKISSVWIIPSQELPWLECLVCLSFCQALHWELRNSKLFMCLVWRRNKGPQRLDDLLLAPLGVRNRMTAIGSFLFSLSVYDFVHK